MNTDVMRDDLMRVIGEACSASANDGCGTPDAEWEAVGIAVDSTIASAVIAAREECAKIADASDHPECRMVAERIRAL